MKKTVRKIGTRKAAAARVADRGARRLTKIAELRASRARDRAAARSGIATARGASAATADAAREFPARFIRTIVERNAEERRATGRAGAR